MPRTHVRSCCGRLPSTSPIRIAVPSAWDGKLGDWSNGEDGGLQNRRSGFDSLVPRFMRAARQARGPARDRPATRTIGSQRRWPRLTRRLTVGAPVAVEVVHRANARYRPPRTAETLSSGCPRAVYTAVMGEIAPGSVFAGHRIEGVAGQGGMGVVYRARQLSLERTVALKVIAPALMQDPETRRRFVRESKVAASIDHPHVIPVYY